jgi:transglutaminase-like putative cysteine protease
VASESLVAVADGDADALNPLVRPAFPAVWMPWEQQMLSPYLTPPELPEPQLKELHDHAAGFVRRNGGDLLETLLDLNRTFFTEYTYAPGSTHLGTTAFEVYTGRRGVCQDFAQLFICLARLIGLPARYVCGYIWTGNTGHSRARSDATHAWVEVYLPLVGWRGFDPTNGVLPGRDHVRVAVGRHYKDATPTEGTLFTPAPESLSVDVEVSEAPPQRKRCRRRT